MLICRKSNQTIYDTVHHYCLGLVSHTLLSWPAKRLQHLCYSFSLIVVVIYISGGSTLNGLKLSCFFFGGGGGGGVLVSHTVDMYSTVGLTFAFNGFSSLVTDIDSHLSGLNSFFQ